MEKYILLHKFTQNFEQIDKVETLTRYDAGGFQSSSHFETNIKGSTWTHAIVRSEIVENANQIFGPAMAKNQHEDHQRHL